MVPATSALGRKSAEAREPLPPPLPPINQQTMIEMFSAIKESLDQMNVS